MCRLAQASFEVSNQFLRTSHVLSQDLCDFASHPPDSVVGASWSALVAPPSALAEDGLDLVLFGVEGVSTSISRNWLCWCTLRSSLRLWGWYAWIRWHASLCEEVVMVTVPFWRLPLQIGLIFPCKLELSLLSFHL